MSTRNMRRMLCLPTVPELTPKHKTKIKYFIDSWSQPTLQSISEICNFRYFVRRLIVHLNYAVRTNARGLPTREMGNGYINSLHINKILITKKFWKYIRWYPINLEEVNLFYGILNWEPNPQYKYLYL